ncbi:MAG TPA: hypothetical protein VHF47_00405 [Acidimicrobiales bacterium]|nr:hypothetical protein [Acidimicrobiales bacterium]
MQFSTVLTKLAAGTVAGVLTLGTGWAFAEVTGEEPAAETPVEQPTAEAPVEEPVVTEAPAEEPVATEPVEEEPVSEPVVTEPVSEPVVTEPVVTEPVTEPGVAPVVTEPVEEAPVVHVRKENHGKHVSETAHTAPTGPGHGAAVSEVARSEVGKKHAAPAAEEPVAADAAASPKGHGKKQK